MAITSPLSAESDGADEYQPKRGAAAGKTTKKVPKTTSKTDKNNTNNKTELQHVEDDVYTPQDAVALQNVHRLIDVSPETRKEWGVPEVSLISKLCVRVCLCVFGRVLLWGDSIFKQARKKWTDIHGPTQLLKAFDAVNVPVIHSFYSHSTLGR
jgi:hypothetical protein